MDTEKQWTTKAKLKLQGRTIKDVRYMTQTEADALGWYSRPLAIFFDDDSYLFASADDEGNDGGAFFTSHDTLPVIPVL